LTDFGIAKLLESAEGHTLTGSGVGIGTPEYMAPEQGIGAHTIDARADIYSLGIVLYEMVTGRKPYIADTPMAVVLKQMTDPLPRPTDFVSDLPEEVEHILFKALAKQSEDRFENMNALIAAMEAALAGGQEIEVQVPSRQVKKEFQQRAKPSLKVVLSIIGVLVVVLIIVLGMPWLKQQFAALPAATAISTEVLVASSAPTVTQLPPTATPFDPVDVNRSLWAESPHADVGAAAFTHWNETDPPEVPITCAKCHATTGFLDYLGVDGSSIDNVDATTPIGEVLECATCHSDETNYKVRNLEAVAFPSSARLDFGSGNSNNICIVCHQGRNSKNTVESAIGRNAPDALIELSSQNPHYDAAGATLFGTDAGGAYEYEGREYAGRYLHADNLLECIDCHNPHSTALNLGTCATCHTGQFNSPVDLRSVRYSLDKAVDYDGDGDIQEGIYGEIETLNQLLYPTIQYYSQERVGKGIGYRGDIFPFYFIDTNGDGTIQDEEAVTENSMTLWTPRLSRAAYNYQWSMKDPGAYAHNPQYMIQILYDTLKDLGADVSALTRPSSTTTLTRTPRPTATNTAIPSWVTDFAEPILAAISEREPYFQDDFGPNTEGWFVQYGKGSISLEGETLRLREGGSIANIYLRNKPDFALQVDISRPASCCVHVKISGENSIYLGPNGWGICRPDWADCSGYQRSFGQKIQVTVIVKDSQAGFYLMGFPAFYLEDPNLADIGRWGNVTFECGEDLCEFDNVKFWNLDKVPDLP
jgi:serine/threonine protein kinase